MNRNALVLFAHGARDPAWAVPLDRLAVLLGERLPDTQIVKAFLELQTPRLDEAIDGIVAIGPAAISVLPVFWARAGHVAHELDPAIDALRARHPDCSFTVMPVLSELPGLLETIAVTVASGLAP